MHCAYAATAAGILKIIGLVIGFMAMTSSTYVGIESAYVADGRNEENCNSAAALLKKTNYVCPHGTFFKLAISIIWLTWLISLIVFIILLLVEIKGGAFRLIDFIGHYVAGLLVIGACALCVWYGAESIAKTKEDCNSIIYVGRHESCRDDKFEYFKTIGAFVAAGLALVTGVIYLVIGANIHGSS